MDQTQSIDYRLLVDNLSTAILLVDRDLNIFYLNSSCEALFDISLIRASGQPVLNLLHMPDDEFNTQEAFLNTIKTGQPYTRREATINVNFKDIHVDYTASQLNAGKPYHPLLLIELNPIDRMLKISKEENFIQQHQVARQLIRGVAHEIKNPLTPIQLSAERLQMKLHDKLSEQDAQLLDRSTNTIVNQVFSLKTMVDDFREYARTPPAQLQSVDLNALITDIAILYGWTPEGNQEEFLYRQISLNLDPNVPNVEADPTQMRQVLNNLLSNSRDAMEDLELEGDEPGIKIQTKYMTGEPNEGMQAVRITIEDRGLGFPQHILQKAFEPYITTKAHGTGLGLAIVRKIIEEHGGKIELSNNKSGGAKISILLARIVKNH